jgi:hypothetical protein
MTCPQNNLEHWHERKFWLTRLPSSRLSPFSFLLLFVLYPLAILLKDGFATKYKPFLFDSFAYILAI